ncbi:MAG: hypothetical protein WBE26_20475 [Phycisphaerae bacterium]
MLKAATGYVAGIYLLLALWSGAVCAQQANPEDEAIDAIRQFTDFGAGDQRRIGEWVEAEVKKFNGFTAFRDRFKGQYGDSTNSPQFRLQLTTQTARVAAERFARPDLNADVAHALAQVLTDMNRAETFPGLMAGLKSSDARARYLCVKGLIAQRRSIAADKAKLDQTVEALREAGLVELSPVVLGRIYQALAYTGQVSTVFDAYLSVFDKRLDQRRGIAVIADGAEIYAYEFFRTSAVLGALDAAQKSQLANRLAVFLRMDAERYNSPGLQFDEIDKIERMLWILEEIFEELVGGGKGGDIREVLQSGGFTERASILKEAYRWVGNPETNESGALNEAPWNIPSGAP